MAAGRNLPSDKLSWNDKAADNRPRGCAVVPASIMPRGFFASLPIDHGRFAGKRENRRNQSHSSRRPDIPAQAPMPPHMAEFVPKCKGSILQCSKTGMLALPCPRDYHKLLIGFEDRQ
ncbi:hypothetical protein LB565_07715 [Mesorhizobium sp. CA14]|uniref:hypothetical protein n=1 Tax=Mesorhizobium sp. CA14 TaxID=2876642 RepID=UPI001CCC4168|nr:hypothetical protein [Mesorhizobium sp. CA14]MBZ9847871.1 hypothetical protein [Mesorhizobium sp. CA14]